MVAQNGNSHDDAGQGDRMSPADGLTPSPPMSAQALQNLFEADLSRLQVRFPLKRFITLIVLIGTLIIAMIVYSAETGLRMSQRYTPLIDAAMEIKLEATTGYLWYEEHANQDPRANMELVRKHIDQADWYARAMLEGGSNAEVTFIPLDDPELRANIEEVRRLLTLFRTKMEQQGRGQRGDTVEHQSTHHMFDSFIKMADIAETRLQNLVQIAEQRFVFVQASLALAAVGVMTVLGFLFVRVSDTQNKTVKDLRREIFRRIRVENTLRKQATTDTLTGLVNRRRMADILQEELNRAKRLNSPFSVVMFDIDHFKRVNDTFGHDTGDVVLQQVASTTKARLRELDVFARWGGEEFLILLRGTERDGAEELSNTCCTRLAQHQIAEVGNVTASFGVATYQTGETVRDIIRRADEALYQAKNSGRNCVVVSETVKSPAGAP